MYKYRVWRRGLRKDQLQNYLIREHLQCYLDFDGVYIKCEESQREELRDKLTELKLSYQEYKCYD